MHKRPHSQRLVALIAVAVLIPLCGALWFGLVTAAQQWDRVAAARRATDKLSELRVVARQNKPEAARLVAEASALIAEIRDDSALIRSMSTLSSAQTLAMIAAEQWRLVAAGAEPDELDQSMGRYAAIRDSLEPTLTYGPLASWTHLQADQQSRQFDAIVDGRRSAAAAELDRMGRQRVRLHEDLVNASLTNVRTQADRVASARLTDMLRSISAVGVFLGATGVALVGAVRVLGDERRRRGLQTDALTGIPGRGAILAAIDELLLRRAEIRCAAVLFVDLDGLKRANDLHGHLVGDAVLVEAARRLGAAVDQHAVVGRLGGDEFLIVLAGETPGELLALGELVVSAMHVPMTVEGRTVRIGASVGIAFVDERSEARSLLHWADLAVRRAKELGRNRVIVCDGSMRREFEYASHQEQALAHALEHEQLHFALQPVWGLDHRISGFEALARWHTEDGRNVTPDEFIPTAEGCGLIDLLDNYVLRRAATEVMQWPEFHEGQLHLSANISGKHLLSHTFVDDIRFVLITTGLPAQQLIVEVTEEVFAADLVTACMHLEQVRALGVRVAIDDFGAGFTSLGHLPLLPADILKIDRSFIATLGTAEHNNLMRLLIELARTHGLSVVAEGVETQVQLEQLRLMTCDAVQGHVLGKAVDPALARQQLGHGVVTRV